VCVSVLEHISKMAGPIFAKFFVDVPWGRGSSASMGVTIRYVLPVLWMNSHFVTMGLMGAFDVCEHISGTDAPSSTNFLCMSSVAVPQSSSSGVTIHYVLPVLWMTSRFFTMGPMDSIKPIKMNYGNFQSVITLERYELRS